MLLSACEVQVSDNIYVPPLTNATSEKDITNSTYSIDDLNLISGELSKLFNKKIDIFSSNKVGFEGEIISSYIDCGYMNEEVYVSYIDRIFGSYLEAIISFKVSKEGNLFRIINEEIKYTFYSKETGTRWRFRTNKPKELLVGNPVYDDNPYRVCLSKNKLEDKIKKIFYKESNG